MIHRDITNGARYRLALQAAWFTPRGSGIVGDALTDYRRSTPADGDRYYIDTMGDTVTGGFIVKASGELVGVFSGVKGRGDALTSAAVNSGATKLDCFDGYLPTLYARHGFVETDRAENWTPGGPDVVYMTHHTALSTFRHVDPERTPADDSPFRVIGHGVYRADGDRYEFVRDAD